MISIDWAIVFSMLLGFLNSYITEEAWLRVMLFGCRVVDGLRGAFLIGFRTLRQASKTCCVHFTTDVTGKSDLYGPRNRTFMNLQASWFWKWKELLEINLCYL